MDNDPGRPAIAVVVLAAGLGRRLDGLGTNLPKWLTLVGGRRVADFQVDAFQHAGSGVECVVVVTGYRSDAITRWLRSRAGRLNPDVVENGTYRELNNWYSLLLGLRRLQERGWSESVIVLNGDLCARPEWYGEFFGAVGRPRRTPAVLAVDFERPLTEEAMKVAVEEREAGERVCTRIGKTGVPGAVGEYVGMAGFDLAGWQLLADTLESFVGQPDRTNEWYEAAFQELMTSHRLFSAWPTVDSDWVEIDDVADWDLASRLIAGAEPRR